jgi:cellulose synthase/poly-beta-1,6-N-acetylglucosamine synthase-like glycosyltransferase
VITIAAVLEIVLLIFAGSTILYVFLLTLLALIPRKKENFELASLRRVAVIIPAHNEERGISQTVAAVRAMKYPADRFVPIVIADNCDDPTAALAKEAGARVLERFDANLRGKGYALRWAIDELLKEEPRFDAFVVIDADSLPSERFLTVMNWYLEHGAAVVQASDLVARENQSWSAQMTRIGFYLYNFVRPLGRRVFGGSVGLRGNGMCFSRRVLEEVPWNAFTIAEDLEFGIHLLLKGFIVEFAPEAIVFATMPEVSQNAVSQRARWEGSRMGLIRRYAWPLLKRAFSGPSLACLDTLFDLVTPAMVNLMGFVGGMIVVSGGLYVIGVVSTPVYLYLWGILLGLGFIHLFVGLRIAGADRATYRSLMSIPRYAIWKLMVYLKMTRKWQSNEWVRTSRE